MNDVPVASSRALSLTLGVALMLALAVGGFVGARLGERASRASAEVLTVVDPESLTARSAEGLASVGGFSGFGGPPALQGEVLRHGIASEVAPGRVVVTDGTANVTVEYTQPQRLYRIARATTAPASGDAAVVTFEGTRATGVLLVRPGVGGAR